MYTGYEFFIFRSYERLDYKNLTSSHFHSVVNVFLLSDLQQLSSCQNKKSATCLSRPSTPKIRC